MNLGRCLHLKREEKAGVKRKFKRNKVTAAQYSCPSIEVKAMNLGGHPQHQETANC